MDYLTGSWVLGHRLIDQSVIGYSLPRLAQSTAMPRRSRSPSSALRKIQRQEEKGLAPGVVKYTKAGPARILTRKKANEINSSGESPLDIMWDNMRFWWKHVRDLEPQLRAMVVNVQDPEARKEAFSLLGQLLTARQNAQVCAVDMAPYCHPKLATVTYEKDPPQLDNAEMPDDAIAASQEYQRLIGGA